MEAIPFILLKFAIKNNDNRVKKIIIFSTSIYFSIVSLSFMYSEKIINNISSSQYQTIDSKIKILDNDVTNSDMYKEFLIDMTNNNKKNIRKYLTFNELKIGSKLINNKLLSIEKEKKFQMILLSKIEFKDSFIKEKLNLIIKDNFISIFEYEEFKEYISKNNNSELISFNF